jgi:hypothetical protein
MLILVLSPLDTQRLYRVRKSAVVDAVEAAFAAGAVSGTGFAAVLFRTTSAQEGELDVVAELYCVRAVVAVMETQAQPARQLRPLSQ